MKGCKSRFIQKISGPSIKDEAVRPELPDVLTDYLTGTEIAFSNRDNIRQKILKLLVEQKGFQKEEITVDREIAFEMEGQSITSSVDILINLNDIAALVIKCASGSLVSRERQIIASARLVEDYVVPFASVTNGNDIELLDSLSEKIICSGFDVFPSRDEFLQRLSGLVLKKAPGKKLLYEKRILYTYDAISCPATPRRTP